LTIGWVVLLMWTLYHPNTKSNILYMNFDLLDQNYLMVKSNLYFEDFDRTGLTSLISLGYQYK
jgi:hypothetical protein